MRITVLGHFSEYSTETQVSDTLEHIMGHTVIRCHEDPHEDSRFVEVAKDSKLLILIGSHHRTTTAFDTLHKLGVKTCSLHLDKFIGIPDREKLDGWQFQVSRQFTADPEITLPTHTWMPPAISEHYCFRGLPRDEWLCDVAFVGAANSYHKEHPWRRKLVDWASACYGDSFIHIGDEIKVHGRDLNDFYASARVIVGDWFSAGLPNYFSDRAPETCGRYGFLLAPQTKGLNYTGMATYLPQDLYDLQRQIDYWLGHEQRRKDRIQMTAEYVRNHSTYTHRMKTILRAMKCMR